MSSTTKDHQNNKDNSKNKSEFLYSSWNTMQWISIKSSTILISYKKSSLSMAKGITKIKLCQRSIKLLV